MTPPLQLRRELDLRRSSDVSELLTLVRRSGSISRQPEDIRNGIEALVRFFPNADWLTLSPYTGGSFLIETGKNKTSSLNLESAVQLGLQLELLKDCEGFSHLLGGFLNPTQFFDSLFETEIAVFCRSQKACMSLEFGPEYLVKGQLKRPDFAMVSTAGRVVCECKSTHEFETQYQRKFGRLYAVLNKAIVDADAVPNDLRAEVHLESQLKIDAEEWAKKVAVKIKEVVKERLVNQVFRLDACKLCVVDRSSSVVFHEFKLARMAVTVGTVATSISPQSAYLRFTTSRVASQRTRAIGNLIRKANLQLPRTDRCVIFIQTLDGQGAKLAGQRRLGTSEYDHVVACGIWSNDSQEFIYRTVEKPLIEELFSPSKAQA